MRIGSLPRITGMRIYFDTEFIEDGETIQLLSIGMAREDGHTYYAEFEADISRANDWVKANVLPLLTGQTKPREQIATEIKIFVGENPEFWAYFSSYDWVALCQLYGRMIDLPAGWPMYCRDLKQYIDERGYTSIDSDGIDHNSLTDAIWVQQTHERLLDWDRQKNDRLLRYEYGVKYEVSSTEIEYFVAPSREQAEQWVADWPTDTRLHRRQAAGPWEEVPSGA